MNSSYVPMLKPVFQDELIAAIAQSADDFAEPKKAGGLVVKNN